ncbi:hypothetical protein [Candidatus Methylomicrobium oryzae]|jgi:hypothetical protein|uniref:hypothetical protein n=1 Tax=Candidatus Methylomicrobium oryzae TaxID=2802053 RepID=UPI0019211952|nr:hypothetical protein [Methylomicrobium sp. RS1]MBL1264728.1 hypothetical protein [Methylomicrobium sp. RS1]
MAEQETDQLIQLRQQRKVRQQEVPHCLSGCGLFLDQRHMTARAHCIRNAETTGLHPVRETDRVNLLAVLAAEFELSVQIETGRIAA